MIKVIPSGSFNYDHPVAQLVDVHSRGVDSAWIEKRAAAMSEAIKSIRPEPGHAFIHLIDMGAQEAYGPNRNGDGFNEKCAEFELYKPKPNTPKIIKLAGGLQEYHPTFMKYAHVYKHHQNKDPKKSIGSVKAAAYNQDMRRGELIIKVPTNHPDWRDDIEKLASGRDIPFSMACKVAYDICSNCGNRAKTRGEYCDHLRDHMSETEKTGHLNFAINDQPNFFDISKVFKPADRIAWSLQKVASICNVGGAELAEQLGLGEPDFIENVGVSPLVLPYKLSLKMAAARKLAEIEKKIEVSAKSDDNKHLAVQSKACPSCKVDDKSMSRLKSASLPGVLHALKEAQICLSPRDFFKLAMANKFDSHVDSEIANVEKLLPGLHKQAEEKGETQNLASDSSYDSESGFITREIRELIEKLAEDHSLADAPASKRLRMSVIRGVQPRMKESEKTAAVSKQAEFLAKEYVKYQISFATSQKDSCSNLTALMNHLTF